MSNEVRSYKGTDLFDFVYKAYHWSGYIPLEITSSGTYNVVYSTTAGEFFEPSAMYGSIINGSKTTPVKVTVEGWVTTGISPITGYVDAGTVRGPAAASGGPDTVENFQFVSPGYDPTFDADTANRALLRIIVSGEDGEFQVDFYAAGTVQS